MLRFLKHLFVPHHTNNHRAKILHNSSLIAIILVLLLSSFLFHIVKKTNPEVLGVSYSISESELLNLVNSQRQTNGLPALSANSALADAARRKAADMLAKNYWAHFAPDGSTSPWSFIREAGYTYTFAGENLAKGFTDAGSVVNAWMNSPTHRENILSSKYKDVGFAIVPGTLEGEETVIIVKMLGSRNTDTLAIAPPEEAEEEIILISPAPSDIPAQVAAEVATPTPFPTEIVKAKRPVEARPKVDAQITSKAASTVGLSLLVFAFLMDVVIVERRKIPRIVGHNLDHVMIILLFLLFVVLKSSGVIL